MSTDRPTLLDIAKATDPNGSPAEVIEILTQMNPILQDAPAYPSNAQMAERVTIRSSLPVSQFAKFNQGTLISKGATTQKVDTIGFIDGLSEVDARLMKGLGAAAVNAYRAREDDAFLESMNQLVALTLLYGDELTSPQSFTGLAPRMSALATAITGSQVWDHGASTAVVGGDGTSIYVADWGEDTAHLIYPRDGEGAAGVDREDLGELRVTDPEGLPFMALTTRFNWMVGLTVKDPRHVARLANIDVSDANLEMPVQGSLILSLIDVITGMPAPNGANRVLYCARRIWAGFHKQAINKSNAALSMGDYLGKMTPMFLGYPIRPLDQMSIAESTVS